jgi:NAD(P)-dependent dehydrogenase (short-subunit alcohol dehydrogenase family)
MPALQAAIDATRDALGPIDVLVCGAAGNFLCRAEDMSPNGFRTVVEIDLIGSFNAARAAFAQLKETKGTILFISAGMAYMPHAFQVHVGAAKAGIEQMMQNLALEWGHYGIRACSIVPGPIAGTEGMKRLSDPDDLAARLGHIPMQRLGTVDDIGLAAVFLASPMASYITGAQLVVDGGSGLAGSAFFNIGAEKALRSG